MSLEANIKTICEILAEDCKRDLEVGKDFNKDKLMILNNLCEYVMPKMTRTNVKDVQLAPDDLGY